jgi:predicted ATPase
MLLERIELDGLLTFHDAALDLRPLNVLIGSNAAGKSNLIRAIGLLRALRRFPQEIAEGGGLESWMNWRRSSGIAIRASGEASGQPYSYRLNVIGSSTHLEIHEEKLDPGFERVFDKYRFLSADDEVSLWNDITPIQSVFSEARSPREPRIKVVGDGLESIRLYREFRTGPGTQARAGISTAGLGEYLSEDGSNLALVLDKLNFHRALKPLNEALNRLFTWFSEVLTYSRGGFSQLYVREEGVVTPMSAASLSDGTLRLLCLLAVVFDPSPAPLVCIEEPEIGLHPDAIRMVAELLVKASVRTQLIVTTHSPALVDALSDQPESIVVCERDFDGFTQFRRLNSSDLDQWLQKYSLGELWQKGEIGGNRW